MAQWRDFDASNEPGTCAWCGNKLRWKTWSKHPSDFGLSWDEYHALPKEQKIERAYDKPGDYGDGFFCGLRCAYSFGVRMAQLGHRLSKKGTE